jgi:hypothetical protein
MDMHGLQICDLCQGYIAIAETKAIRFGNQDYHVACYQEQIHILMTQQVALARQTSWRESDRALSLSRVMGS